jgi:hypothetical protein
MCDVSWFEDGNLIQLAQDRVQWRAFVITVMNLSSPITEGNFLIGWITQMFLWTFLIGCLVKVRKQTEIWLYLCSCTVVASTPASYSGGRSRVSSILGPKTGYPDWLSLVLLTHSRQTLRRFPQHVSQLIIHTMRWFCLSSWEILSWNSPTTNQIILWIAGAVEVTFTVTWMEKLGQACQLCGSVT